MQKFKESFRTNTPIEIGQLQPALRSTSVGRRKRRSRPRGRLLPAVCCIPEAWPGGKGTREQGAWPRGTPGAPRWWGEEGIPPQHPPCGLVEVGRSGATPCPPQGYVQVRCEAAPCPAALPSRAVVGAKCHFVARLWLQKWLRLILDVACIPGTSPHRALPVLAVFWLVCTYFRGHAEGGSSVLGHCKACWGAAGLGVALATRLERKEKVGWHSPGAGFGPTARQEGAWPRLPSMLRGAGEEILCFLFTLGFVFHLFMSLKCDLLFWIHFPAIQAWRELFFFFFQLCP